MEKRQKERAPTQFCRKLILFSVIVKDIYIYIYICSGSSSSSSRFNACYDQVVYLSDRTILLYSFDVQMRLLSLFTVAVCFRFSSLSLIAVTTPKTLWKMCVMFVFGQMQSTRLRMENIAVPNEAGDNQAAENSKAWEEWEKRRKQMDENQQQRMYDAVAASKPQGHSGLGFSSGESGEKRPGTERLYTFGSRE